MVGTYDDIIDGIRLSGLCLSNTVMRNTLDAQYTALLKRPRGDIKRKESIPILIPSTRALLLLLRTGKLISEHIDTASPHDAPARLGLEASEDSESRASPEALPAPLGRVDKHVSLPIRRRIRRETLRGRVQDGHQLRIRVGARREREGDPREEDFFALCFAREDWECRGIRTRRGHGDGYDGAWARALGEVRDERGVWWWED